MYVCVYIYIYVCIYLHIDPPAPACDILNIVMWIYNRCLGVLAGELLHRIYICQAMHRQTHCCSGLQMELPSTLEDTLAYTFIYNLNYVSLLPYISPNWWAGAIICLQEFRRLSVTSCNSKCRSSWCLEVRSATQ